MQDNALKAPSQAELDKRKAEKAAEAAKHAKWAELQAKGKKILEGVAASPGIGAGTVRVVARFHDEVHDTTILFKIRPGEVLVTERTEPYDEPYLAGATAIVTNLGGETCWAGLSGRRLGIPAVTGASDATQIPKDGQKVVVDGNEGAVNASNIISSQDILMDKLNFSWLIDNEVAGHAEPRSYEDLAWLFAKGIRSLVRMSQNPRVSPGDIESMGLDDLHEPFPNFTAPSQKQLSRIVDFVMESIWHGKPVGVSCGAGIGRTGTVLACYLAKRNLTANGLILAVRRKRPGSVETKEQIEAVEKFLRYTID